MTAIEIIFLVIVIFSIVLIVYNFIQPSNNSINANNNVQIGFVARNKHYEQRLISSSGSIFPPIATWILESGGIVVGAAYDEKYNVIQKAITSVEELPSLQGSKYLQCKINKASTTETHGRTRNIWNLLESSGMSVFRASQMVPL